MQKKMIIVEELKVSDLGASIVTWQVWWLLVTLPFLMSSGSSPGHITVNVICLFVNGSEKAVPDVVVPCHLLASAQLLQPYGE